MLCFDSQLLFPGVHPGVPPEPLSVLRGIRVAFVRPLACNVGLGQASMRISRHLRRTHGQWKGWVITELSGSEE